MEPSQDDDLARVRDLLQHIGEFVAYFELAESKMVAWRQEIEQKSSLLQENTNALHHELTLMQHLFSQSGVEHFRQTVAESLSQGEKNLKHIEYNCKQFTQNVQQQQQQIKELTTDSIEKIEKYTSQAVQNINNLLTKYDVNQFHRIASESCDHVERVATNAVVKSNKLLTMFQYRITFWTALTTLITVFIAVLYLNDEFPWEIHQQTMKQREAGKVLLQAWPNLSQDEKTKIINAQVPQRG